MTQTKQPPANPGRFTSSAFFLQALLVKLRSTYVRFGREQTDDLPLRKLVAEIRADLAGKSGSERERYVNGVLQDLTQRKLVEGLRQKMG